MTKRLKSGAVAELANAQACMTWKSMEKILAAEGIVLSQESQQRFAAFDQAGATAAERRAAIIAHHSKKRA